MSLPKYVNIEGNETLVRDTFSMGVVNTNRMALEHSKRLHHEAMKKIAEQRQKDMELNTLRSEVDELKKLVAALLERQGA